MSGNSVKSSIKRQRRHTVLTAVVLGIGSQFGLSAANAQVSSTWTGAVSQNWNDPANWSNGFPNGAFPDGVATINTDTGNYPIVSADPAFTPSDIVIGDGVGTAGRLDQTAGNLASGATNWFFVGREGGTGTYNLNGGTLTTGDLRMSLTATTANATVNVSNATLNANGAIYISNGSNNTATQQGVLNVNGGGTVNSEFDVVVAFAGSSAASGELNVAAGGTLNVATNTKRWLIVSQWDSLQGRVNVNGGTVNLNTNTDLRFSVGSYDPGANSGTSVVNLNSGAITSYSGNQTGAGAGVVDLNNNATTASVNNTFNLNGGTLSVRQILTSRNNGTANFNFNGGTLKATGATSSFISLGGANQKANIQNGGAIIDTNGFDVTIPEPLVGAGTGGLTKNGAGVMTLSGASTYTGATVINGGTLRLATGGPPAAVAHYTFDELASGSLAGGTTVLNTGTGGVTMNGTVNHSDNVLDPGNGGTSVVAGHSGNGVEFDGFGSSIDIASQIVDQSGSGSWTFSGWLKTATPGSSILSKDDGNGAWDPGDAVFYLGTNPISSSGGNLPTGVRNSGGFMQTDPSPTNVADDSWHMVTFVSNLGAKVIYVDGVATPMTLTDFNNGDTSVLTRLGYNLDTLVGIDGTQNLAGTLDELTFWDTGLDATQVQSLFATNTVTTGIGSQQYLPMNTAVSLPVSGAMLDLNNNNQVIGSLSGVAGSALALGTGNLTSGGNNSSTTFAGVISGTGGVVKAGSGTLTLTGANSYTGTSVVQAGVLKLTPAAITTVLGNTSVTTQGGADIQGGKIVFDYTGSPSLASQVRSILDAGFDQSTKFSSGRLRSSTLAAGRTLGWRDTGSTVEVAYTLPGDSDLNFVVNFADLVALAQNYNGTNKVWSQGDFDYSTTVNFSDLVLLAQNYNKSLTAAQASLVGSAFASDYARALSLVPEPTTLTAMAMGVLAFGRRRRVD